MNKSTIEWTQFTSNPVRGKCLHACPYCYGERIRKRFGMPEELSWHAEELFEIEKRKKPSVIFMGSMHDLFGEWVPKDWIMWILDTVKNCPQHSFLFLTKNPQRYIDFEFPLNCYVGATITQPSDITIHGMLTLNEKNNVFISFEPLLHGFPPGNIPVPYGGSIIIGAMTGPGAIKPEKAWIMELIEAAKRNECKIFLKDNLLQLFPELPRVRELAWLN